MATCVENSPRRIASEISIMKTNFEIENISEESLAAYLIFSDWTLEGKKYWRSPSGANVIANIRLAAMWEEYGCTAPYFEYLHYLLINGKAPEGAKDTIYNQMVISGEIIP